jgi:hypothetical protein
MPRGVGGGLVRVLDAGPITAWVETVAERTITPTVEGAKAHDAIAEAALGTGATPLPARFGQTFDSDDGCRAALLEQQLRLTADLERVRGLVEMRVVVALRMQPPEDRQSAAAETADSPGRAYMLGLRESRKLERIVQTSAVAVRRRLTETVGAFVRGEAVSLAPLPAAVLTVSHLITRDVVPRYRSALLEARLDGQVERIVVSGPGAPYGFVTPPHD